MLQEFDGTLLVISHDRYFLDRLVDRVVEVEDRRLAGPPRDLRGVVARRGRREPPPRRARGAGRGGPRRKDEARRAFEEERERRRERDRLLSRLREAEARVAGLEERQRDLERQIEEAFGSAAHAEGARLAADLARVRAEVEAGYGLWEETAAALEAFAPDPAEEGEEG